MGFKKIPRTYLWNNQLIIILILWLEYPNTEADQKTIEKLKEYKKNALKIHTENIEYIGEQNDNVKSEYDTKTFIASHIDEEEKGFNKSLNYLDQTNLKLIQGIVVLQKSIKKQFCIYYVYSLNSYQRELSGSTI